MSHTPSDKPTTEWFARAEIDRRKLDAYLLSPTHPRGRHKARLWRSVFGIGEEDGDLLERLIREQIHQAEQVSEKEARRDRDDPEVIYRRYEVTIPDFRGPNGNVGPVLTAWTHDPRRDRPHLTNAFPVVD